MKVQIILEYKSKTYISNVENIDINYYQDLKSSLVDGDLNFITFVCKNERYYFGEDILKKSIITLKEIK